MWNLDSSKEYLLNFVTSDYFIGAAALLGLLIFCKFCFRKHLLYISCSKLGRTRVSEHALKTVISAVCKERDEIIRSRIKLRIKHGKINIFLKLKLGTYINLSTLALELQNQLNSIFIDDLGLNNLGKINIIISGFSDYECSTSKKFVAEYSCNKSSESRSENGS